MRPNNYLNPKDLEKAIAHQYRIISVTVIETERIKIAIECVEFISKLETKN